MSEFETPFPLKYSDVFYGWPLSKCSVKKIGFWATITCSMIVIFFWAYDLKIKIEIGTCKYIWTQTENIHLIWMFDLIFRLVRNPLRPQPLVQLPKSFSLLYPLIVVFAEVFIPIFAKLSVMNCKPGTTLTMLVLSALETSPVPNFPGI